MQSSLTIAGTFWFFGGCAFLGFVFVYILMPETKGKTLEEIEAFFEKHKQSYQPIDWKDLTNYSICFFFSSKEYLSL